MTDSQHFSRFLNTLSQRFVDLHEAKEDSFWEMYMGLGSDQDQTQQQFAQAEQELKAFLQDPDQLAQLVGFSSNGEAEHPYLNGWIAMFQANAILDPEARKLSARITEMEAELLGHKQKASFGLVEPATQKFTQTGLRQLALIMGTDPDEGRRKAAYEGLLAAEQFVLAHGFLDIVRERNRLARMLGYEDFYAYRVATIERMTKTDLFTLLDSLASAIAPRAAEEVAHVAQTFGEGAFQPWNFGFYTKGQISKDLDPYFPIEDSLARWGCTFQGFGIDYNDALLTIDLIDRKGKHPNPFMHGPGLSYLRSDGNWNSAKINFTANAVPGQVGSGFDAMNTLLHEGGHAAHFANVRAGAPCFSHEFAPSSTGFMETQSMFLDAFTRDPLWKQIYATDRAGNTMPEELNLLAYREDKRMRPWQLMSLLTIVLGERQLYETPDGELTAERVTADARRLEQRLQGLSAGNRPLFSVPHWHSSDSAANYHGYALAAMGVAMTRDYFYRFRPCLVNNPLIGRCLKTSYWIPGNSRSFAQMIRDLTGEQFSPRTLIRDLLEDVDTACARERDLLGFWGSRAPRVNVRNVGLNADIRMMHGNEHIAESSWRNGLEFADMCEAFANWVRKEEGKGL